MMADFYHKITADQGSVEELIRKIPGFKGYFEREDRREADRLLRDYLVRVFEEQLAEFNRIQRDLVDAGGIEYMERAQRVDTKLRTFIDRIAAAARGYAGLFDAIKIEQDDLQRVYAFDQALLGYQDQLVAGLAQLDKAVGSEETDVGAVLRQLESVVTEANNTFERRSEVMKGLTTAE
jgi:hypothetical protein